MSNVTLEIEFDDDGNIISLKQKGDLDSGLVERKLAPDYYSQGDMSWIVNRGNEKVCLLFTTQVEEQQA